MLVTVDPDRCTGCGRCVRICPSRVLELRNGRPYSEADTCLACGHCVSVCPTASISCALSPLPDAEELRFQRPEAAKVREYMRSRRSVREFRSDVPSEREFRDLLDLACSAETAMNVRKVSFVVICGREKVKAVADRCADWIEHSESEYIRNRYRRVLAQYRDGYDSITCGAPCLIVSVAERGYERGRQTATIYQTYAELYAPSIGLGTCWAGILENMLLADLPDVNSMLGIPDGGCAVGALMAGYPDVRFRRMPYRDPAEIRFF